MVMGVFSDEGLKELISKKVILSKDKIKRDQVQPSSIDLRLGAEGFCLPYSSIPSEEDNLRNYFDSIDHYKVDLREEGFLHKGNIYVIKLQEGLDLPSHLAARSNPKSSIGRSDVHVRLITERGKFFDKVSSGYKGDLWLEIVPRSFDINVKEGMFLNQLRIFDEQNRMLGEDELIGVHREEGILFGKNKLESIASSLNEGIISLELGLDRSNPGYVARDSAPILDLSKRDNPASEYFEKVHLKSNGDLVLEKDKFYVLSSAKRINIPLSYCSEMLDIDTGSGEFRAHYAGFFDPGFFAQGVVEVRNLGANFILKEGQTIANLAFFPMKSIPKKPYGSKGSNYQGQEGPRLAKFFDMDK